MFSLFVLHIFLEFPRCFLHLVVFLKHILRVFLGSACFFLFSLEFSGLLDYFFFFPAISLRAFLLFCSRVFWISWCVFSFFLWFFEWGLISKTSLVPRTPKKLFWRNQKYRRNPRGNPPKTCSYWVANCPASGLPGLKNLKKNNILYKQKKLIV